MADPRITLGNPFINPTGWQQHPVDWVARAAEERAEEEALAAKETLLDFIFFSPSGRPFEMIRANRWYRARLTGR